MESRLKLVLKAGMDHYGIGGPPGAAADTDSPSERFMLEKMNKRDEQRKQKVVDDRKSRRDEKVADLRLADKPDEPDEPDVLALANVYVDAQIYCVNHPADKGVGDMTVFLLVGKFLSARHPDLLPASEVDELAIEVEYFTFLSEAVPYEDDVPDSPDRLATPLIGAVFTEYEFTFTRDITTAAGAIAEGIKAWINKAREFVGGAREARRNRRKKKSILDRLYELGKAIFDHLPIIILLASNAYIQYHESEDGNPLLQRDEYWKEQFNKVTALFRNFGSTLISADPVNPVTLDPERNAGYAQAIGGTLGRIWDEIKAYGYIGDAFAWKKKRMEIQSAHEAIEGARGRMAFAKRIASGTAAGATRATQTGILVWNFVYLLMKLFFNHSHKRLSEFVSKKVGTCEQKYSMIVFRKYYAVLKKGEYRRWRNDDGRFPRLADDVADGLSIKGKMWKDLTNNDNYRTMTPDELFTVCQQQYLLWMTHQKKTLSWVNSKSAKFFKGDAYSTAVNTATGVGFGFTALKEVIEADTFGIRSYVSVLGQAVSIGAYMYWRMKTYYSVQKLLETLKSVDSTKRVMQSYLTLGQDAANIEADWNMEAQRRPTRENQPINRVNMNNITNPRPSDDKINMDNVICSDAPLEDESEDEDE